MLTLSWHRRYLLPTTLQCADGILTLLYLLPLQSSTAVAAVAATTAATNAHLSVQVEEQMSSIDEVKHQIQLASCLEAVAQCHDVGVHHCCQDITLSTDVVPVILLQDALLAHDLHGIYLAAGASTDLEDLHVHT